MEVTLTADFEKEISGIVEALPILDENAVVSIALRIGIDAWKKEPKLIASILNIAPSGADDIPVKPKAPRKPRTPKVAIPTGTGTALPPSEKKEAEPVKKIRSANTAGDSGFKKALAKPAAPADEDDLLGLGSSEF